MEIRTAFLSTRDVPFITKDDAIKDSILHQVGWAYNYGEDDPKVGAAAEDPQFTINEMHHKLQEAVNAAYEAGVEEGKATPKLPSGVFPLNPHHPNTVRGIGGMGVRTVMDDDEDDDDEEYEPVKKRGHVSKAPIPKPPKPRPASNTYG